MANLWLFIFVSCILLKGTYSEREGVICYNSTLEDYRLKGSVVKRSFVQSEMIDCLMECATEQCCRSINYKKHLKDNETNCEMLHSVVDETESHAVLEKNASYDHIYLANTAKTFNESCVQDTDECALGTYKCHSNGTCINTIGSYKCHCRSGFSGNGETCSDVDECAQPGNPKCHLNATCNNTIGSYECHCRRGFAGNGTTCSDIDECASGTHKCHSNATCNNTIGSYECHCRRGFFGNGKTCSVHEFDSEILSGESPEFTKLLGKWLPETGNWSVCWRATNISKKECAKFHEGCDGKVPTLTVVEVVKNGTDFVFGGFATSGWAKPMGSSHASSSAPGSFLFSFRNNDDLAPFKLPLKDANHQDAIQRYQNSAVKFGTGPDLSIADDTNTNEESYLCYANIGAIYKLPPGYIFLDTKTQSLLAGKLEFIPAKVEVLYLN